MRNTFSLVCVQNDRDSVEYILGTTAQIEAAREVKDSRIKCRISNSKIHNAQISAKEITSC